MDPDRKQNKTLRLHVGWDIGWNSGEEEGNVCQVHRVNSNVWTRSSDSFLFHFQDAYQKTHLQILSATFIHSFIRSFIHSDYFYSFSSSPLLLRGAPDTARILYRNFSR